MKFMLDFKNGFREGCLDLLWLVEEIVMWARVILAYIVFWVLMIPAAITQLSAGFVLIVGMMATKEGSHIHGVLQDAMIGLLGIVGILAIPAASVFSWLIPERYIFLLYLRKTEELKEETKTW